MTTTSPNPWCKEEAQRFTVEQALKKFGVSEGEIVCEDCGRTLKLAGRNEATVGKGKPDPKKAKRRILAHRKFETQRAPRKK